MKSLDPQLAQQFQHGRLVRHSLSLAYSATQGGQLCSSIQLNMKMAHGPAGAVGVAKDYSHIWSYDQYVISCSLAGTSVSIMCDDTDVLILLISFM